MSQPNGSGRRRSGARALRAALKARGWKQKDLARRLSVTPPTVSRWLSAERVPDRAHMRKLQRVLGLSPEVWM